MYANVFGGPLWPLRGPDAAMAVARTTGADQGGSRQRLHEFADRPDVIRDSCGHGGRGSKRLAAEQNAVVGNLGRGHPWTSGGLFRRRWSRGLGVAVLIGGLLVWQLV